MKLCTTGVIPGGPYSHSQWFLSHGERACKVTHHRSQGESEQRGDKLWGVTFLVFYLKRHLCPAVLKIQSSALLLAFGISTPTAPSSPFFKGMGQFLFPGLHRPTVRFAIQLYAGKVKCPLSSCKGWYLFYLKILYNTNSLPWCSQRGLKNY